MGNRTSSTHHYPPPPPHWMGSRMPPYSASNSPYPDHKRRPIGPGAFAESYDPTNRHQIRRSMISLTGEMEPRRLRPSSGSHMSLNHVDFDPMMCAPPPPQFIVPPDAKTLKKLEKMEKKHQKLMKKLSAKGIPMVHPPPPLPQMHPMFRAMSFDELNRNNEPDGVRLRQWRTPGETRAAHSRRHQQSQSQYVRHNNYSARSDLGGSLASSSPMTSSEEGGHSTDLWNSSSVSSSRNNHRDVMSPPIFSSTPHQPMSPRPTQPISKTIEVKVQRSEKIERTSQEEPRKKNSTSSTPTYSQPLSRGPPAYGSRTSSVATSQMRCDQSEIDFSWVNEEEDKLKREKNGPTQQQLPEYYFGMDPPNTTNINNSPGNDEKENGNNNNNNQWRSVQEKTKAFEIEARRKEPPSFISRSSHHIDNMEQAKPLQVHTKDSGPAERRIHRIQRQTEQQNDRRYRSSMAF